MKPAVVIIEDRITAAMAAVTGRDDCAAIVRPATDPKFGDYQANGVMALAKKIKSDPRKLAEQIVAKLDLNDVCEPPEVAGPGFINLRLKTDFIANKLLEINSDREGRLAIDRIAQPKTIVVDFSGPNIAKQMHVGHLRSTIIGDCVCRLLEFLGHNVIRQNHIGDWGTHFGMLCAYFDHRILKDAEQKLEATTGGVGAIDTRIADVEQFYREAKRLFDADPQFAAWSRDMIAKLHSGDKRVVHNWRMIRGDSLAHCQEIYDSLGVNLTSPDVRGESEYKDELPGIVGELEDNNLAVESEGAVCVFPEGFKNKEGQPLPLIVQKSDGAYLYATTDLAALRYRVSELGADTIIYVTDARQSLHFEMVFAVARMAGWAKKNTELIHVTFGKT
ncbi:MAG: arginine--tRNA ligase [Planctomycetota bacterium]